MKKCYFKLIIYEFFWFFKGEINIVYLKEYGVKIWDEWVIDEGEFGFVYGYQWCSWDCGDGMLVD